MAFIESLIEEPFLRLLDTIQRSVITDVFAQARSPADPNPINWQPGPAWGGALHPAGTACLRGKTAGPRARAATAW